MALKKYEIDAIVNTINSKIKDSIVIPDFTKVLKEKKKAFDEIQNISQKIVALNKKIMELRNSHKLGYGNVWDETIEYNNEKSKYIGSKMPPSNEIQRAVILSNNKDLNSIIDEILSRYIS